MLVLKGDRTIIALPDGSAWVNPTGNPGMATGGTGDILTGMTAGVLAQMPHDYARAAIAAVYLHGLAGDVAVREHGRALAGRHRSARCLPEAFRRAALAAKEATRRIG